jgi:hypothetical protein
MLDYSNMDFYRLTRIWDPGRFQGRGLTRSYFEGWYFKLVTASPGRALAVIPGLSLGTDGESYSFIQVLDGREGKSWFLRYPVSSFQADSHCFSLRVGPGLFSPDGIELSINENDLRLEGRLKFGNNTPWPVTPLSPGAMGWYAFVPRMECNHAVLSFDHSLEGALALNEERTDFTGGRGYIEKDWGTSFPAYHVWCQSNSFGRPGISVMVSLAKIPWRGSWFNGFLAALLLEGRLYRFTTYSRARLSRLEMLQDKGILMHFSSRRHRLEIETHKAVGASLASPVSGAMSSHLKESLDAKLNVRLLANPGKNETVLFSGTGACAGLEIEATLDQLKGIRA